MAWCDPCAADPLSPEELRGAGVFWLGGDEPAIGVAPGTAPPIASPRAGSGAQPVMLTRLHLRYTPETLPEDLMFQETQDRQNFQARYVLRHAWKGDAAACEAAPRYFDEVAKRQEREAQTLASLTGWDLNQIRARMSTRLRRPRRCGGSGCGNDALAAERRWRRARILPKDARVFQILFLALLLTTGVLLRDFSLHPLQMALAFAAGLATQAFWLKRLGLEQRGFLSAIVTCCGLSLLLRSDTLWAHPLVAALAMSSKFVLRIHGKHLYNPANLGVIAAITLIPGNVGVAGSMGQRSRAGGLVVDAGNHRHDSAHGGWTSAGCFSARFWGWSRCAIMLLGQSWAIWWHQLGNGALLLFAFFMISDPMTIPNRRGPRIALCADRRRGGHRLAVPCCSARTRLSGRFPGDTARSALGSPVSRRRLSPWRPIPLRACATSGTPPTAVAEGWPAPARSATAASSSSPALPSPTSSRAE